MKSKSAKKRWMRFEQLEGRNLLSAVSGLPAAVATNPTVSSNNWSGYVINASKDSVTSVGGSWTVPAVTTTTNQFAFASVKVGIDGYLNNTMEEIGTRSKADLLSGGLVTDYYAWYEMYPGYEFTIGKATSTMGGGRNVSAIVNPADSITASVTCTRTDQFTLTITDTTEQWTYTTKQSLSTADRASAEWIVENSFGALNGQTPLNMLANFGSVTFSGCWATISGITGAVDNGFNNNYAPTPINMVSSSGTILDTTGPLTDTTTSPITSSFTVTYGGSTSASPSAAETSGATQASTASHDHGLRPYGHGSGHSETNVVSQGQGSSQSSFRSALDIRDAVFASFDAHAPV